MAILTARRINLAISRIPISALLAGFACAAPPLPDLQIRRLSPATIELSWSDQDNEWIEWYPESASNLNGGWLPITTPPVAAGGRLSIQQTTGGNSHFYRLARSPVIFVDASNPLTGDGSLGDPFQTIGLGIGAARQSFLLNGRRPVVYVFAGEYAESLMIDSTGLTDYRLTLMDSTNMLEVGGTTVGGGLGDIAILRPGTGQPGISVDGLESFALLGFDVRTENAHCVEVDGVDDARK